MTAAATRPAAPRVDARMDRCPACDGNGWITKYYQNPLMQGLFEETCRECNGVRVVEIRGRG